jgi:bla regulator protein blaR1
MKKSILPAVCLLIFTAIIPDCYAKEQIDFASLFKGYDGCFVLYDLNNDSYTRFNPKRCDIRLSPCSTFKIPNSMIGLETGVISDQNHLYKWDGKKRWLDSWNKDHTLKTAISHSVVWYYQRLAEQVGQKRMSEYIKKLQYGNQDISSGLTTFWLGGSLKISAHEQIEFIKRFYKNDLPFTQRSINITKEILILEKNNEYTFRGKTGSGMVPDKTSWGWFVGYVTCDDNAYIFATNIEAQKGANGGAAREITKNILRSMSLIK